MKKRNKRCLNIKHMKAVGYIEKALFIFIFYFLSSLSLSLFRVHILGKTDNYGSRNSQKSRLTSVSLALLRCPLSSVNWGTTPDRGGKQLTAREKLNGTAARKSVGSRSSSEISGPRQNPGIHEVDDRPRSRFHAIYFGFSTYNGFDEDKGREERNPRVSSPQLQGIRHCRNANFMRLNSRASDKVY